MQKSKSRVLMAVVLAVMLLVSVLTPLDTALAESSDVTSVLTDLRVSVTQNGVPVGESGTLTSTAPIAVEISFGVPVAGDDPEPQNPVKQGDTAVFELSDAFSLVSGTSPIELKMGNTVVGHAAFSQDATSKMVTATVTFDGEDAVFAEDGDYNTVSCTFGANLQYDQTASGSSE